MRSGVKILFVRPFRSSFIEKDLVLLRKHFDVRVADFVLSREHSIGTHIMGLVDTIRGVLWGDVTFSWFADFHSYVALLLSKTLRKKSIVPVGGYEVARVPEIGYGSMLKWWRARIVRFIIENADRVLTVDDSLKRDAIINAGVDGRNIQTVPTGYDCERFRAYGKKEHVVISVFAGDNWARARLKGMDTFIRSARFLSDVRFMVIGIQGDALEKLQETAPLNVEFMPPLSQGQLIAYYQKARVYCQLSMREGLPNALCEAMLCECVPVGTKIPGIATAIGDTGFYVPNGNPKATAQAIGEALRSSKGKYARERIKKMFPMERREKELINIINNLNFGRR